MKTVYDPSEKINPRTQKTMLPAHNKNVAEANTFIAFAVVGLWLFISSPVFANIPYDGQGDLLTDYTDPSGNVLLKAEYDSDGRVTRQTDGLGRQVQITHDTAHNFERVSEVPSVFRSPSSLNHAALSCQSELLTQLSKN
jgi:YD repeat-containing protein